MQDGTAGIDCFSFGLMPPVTLTAGDSIISTGSILQYRGLTEIQPEFSSVQVHWTTDVASTRIVRYGLTAALGDSVVDTNPVTAHDVTVPGLASATVHHYSVGSGDVKGTNFSTTRVFCTASPAQVTGEINAYFNQSVNMNLAWLHPANGNQNLPAWTCA